MCVEARPPASGPSPGRIMSAGFREAWSAGAVTGPSGRAAVPCRDGSPCALLPSDSLFLELCRPCAGGTARGAERVFEFPHGEELGLGLRTEAASSS